MTIFTNVHNFNFFVVEENQSCSVLLLSSFILVLMTCGENISAFFGFQWSNEALSGVQIPGFGPNLEPKNPKKNHFPSTFFFKLHINHVKPNSEVWTEKKVQK